MINGLSVINNEHHSENNITNNNDDNHGYKQELSNLNRAIKRTNEKGCNYRLKFNYDESNKVFVFDNTSFLNHNHAPSNLTIEVS